MQQLVNNRWYALAELILVLTYGVVVTIRPSLGRRLIVSLLLPWLIRLAHRRVSFGKIVLVYPIALVIISAAIGVWAAYDRQAAWGRFWIISRPVAVFIALIHQSNANLGVVIRLVGLMGVKITIIFILNNNWTIQSSDFSLIGRMAIGLC